MHTITAVDVGRSIAAASEELQSPKSAGKRVAEEASPATAIKKPCLGLFRLPLHTNTVHWDPAGSNS